VDGSVVTRQPDEAFFGMLTALCLCTWGRFILRVFKPGGGFILGIGY